MTGSAVKDSRWFSFWDNGMAWDAMPSASGWKAATRGRSGTQEMLPKTPTACGPSAGMSFVCTSPRKALSAVHMVLTKRRLALSLPNLNASAGTVFWSETCAE